MNREYKWKCDICGTGFDNFQAQGFDCKIYCPLCYFKEKTRRLELEIAELKKKNRKYEKIIDKAIQIWKGCRILMPHEFDWEEQFEKASYKVGE